MPKHLHSTDTPVDGDAPIFIAGAWQYEPAAAAAVVEEVVIQPDDPAAAFPGVELWVDTDENPPADVVPALTDLADVNDPTPPVDGDVPTWTTDHWEFQPPPNQPPPALTTLDTATVDLTLAGTGVPADPWVLSADAILDPPLPTVAVTFVADEAVVAVTGETELVAPTVRAAITNPHPTKQLLVRVESNGTFELKTSIPSTTFTQFSGIKVVVGAASLVTVHAVWRHLVPADAPSAQSSDTFGYYHIPPGGSATWGVTAWVTNLAGNTTRRNVAIAALPVRYE